MNAVEMEVELWKRVISLHPFEKIGPAILPEDAIRRGVLRRRMIA